MFWKNHHPKQCLKQPLKKLSPKPNALKKHPKNHHQKHSHEDPNFEFKLSFYPHSALVTFM